MYIPNLVLPQALNDIRSRENDVTILIGENGSGKSQLLARLTDDYLQRSKTVIAISNSIHDKFPSQRKNLHLLRDRAGRQKVKRAIKNALLSIPPDEITRLKSITTALGYVGYDPVVGIHKTNVSEKDFLGKLEQWRVEQKEIPASPNEIEALRSLLLKAFSGPDIVWLSLSDFSFSEIDRASFIELLRYEHILKKMDLITELEISLRKKKTDYSSL